MRADLNLCMREYLSFNVKCYLEYATAWERQHRVLSDMLLAPRGLNTTAKLILNTKPGRTKER